jgi:WD40 repeat protein
MPSTAFLDELRTHLAGHGEQPSLARWAGRRPWMAPPLDSRTVGRPELADEVVRLLTDAGGTVALTGVVGTGGFGKTTLAAIVCHRPEMDAQFPGGLVWATIGEDPSREQLVATINDLCEQLTGQRSTLSSPEQAGFHLGELLDQRPATLLVVDDVWRQPDLTPFLLGGRAATRLVTTRMAAVLPADAHRVKVDQLRAEQARQLLTAGLPPLPAGLVDQLLTQLGGWALVIALANGGLRGRAGDGGDVAYAARELVDDLMAVGPVAADGRDQRVAVTVGRSLELLDDAARRRYLDLGIFPEDTDIPLSVLSLLWGLSTRDTRRACVDLAELSLVQNYQPEHATLRLHDVLRSHLRHELGPDQLRDVHSGLIDAAASQLLPVVDDPAEVGSGVWWELPDDAAYVWQRLTYHLHEAGRDDELPALLTDLRWVEEKTRRFGTASIEVDLTYGSGATVDELRRTIRQQAHLLGPVEPAHSHADILASRVGTNPHLAGMAVAFTATLGNVLTRVTNHWAPPDAADARLQRTLGGHTNRVSGVAIAPDGTWLATTGYDGTVRIWDAVSGVQRAQLDGHTSPVAGVAIAPDGTWLASTSDDGTVRIWDAVSGVQRAQLDGHTSPVTAVAIAPDGTWLATTGWDCAVRIWDAVSGVQRAQLDGHTSTVTGVAIAPDGTWLASTSVDGTVRVWDAASGVQRAQLDGHSGPVTGVAIAPDGTWLATTGWDRAVRIWDAVSGVQRAKLTGHTDWVLGVAIAPDGTWLATTGDNGTVRVWDVVGGVQRAQLDGHDREVLGVAIAPDGTWLATTGDDGTVRVWDVVGGVQRAQLDGHDREVSGVAIAPDGTWLATTSWDRTVRVWDAVSGVQRTQLNGHTHWVSGVAISPDGTWLATTSYDQTLRVWDAVSGVQRAQLNGHTEGVSGVAISPDGTWLASTSWDWTVRVWDAVSGMQRAKLTGHTDQVSGVAIAPDGTWLATTSYDRTVRIWDAASGEQRARLDGHTRGVSGVAIAPDGTWLATTSNDGTVRIWDAASGMQRAQLADHQPNLATMRVDGSLATVACHPDGRRLYVAGSRGPYAFTVHRPIAE